MLEEVRGTHTVFVSGPGLLSRYLRFGLASLAQRFRIVPNDLGYRRIEGVGDFDSSQRSFEGFILARLPAPVIEVCRRTCDAFAYNLFAGHFGLLENT